MGEKNSDEEIRQKVARDRIYFTLITAGAIAAMVYLDFKTNHVYHRSFSRPSASEPIQKNVLGGHEPEVYVEHDGVRYFSRIDGKDISELVK